MMDYSLVRSDRWQGEERERERQGYGRREEEEGEERGCQKNGGPL